MIAGGIDLGSRFVKIVINNRGENHYLIFDTIEFYKEYVKKIDNKMAIDISNFPFRIDKLFATGYGRNLLNFSNVQVISEIKAHYMGAMEQTGENNFVLVDIGGQDSKVIFVRDGYIEDFVMNDKCAASSGRFIETVSSILKVPIGDMGKFVNDPVKLSSTCSVFAESEIIGKIAEGYPFEEIMAGVNESIAKRILPHLKKYTKHKIFAGGGVAMLEGVIFFMEKHLNKKIQTLPNPHFNGAIGCMAYASRKID
ncbi:MAG: acyl-CoA dehydratase activase [Calditerrivibrio sp.]|nr:acyl-CoA dehydratase activase [Calditerrivibrio sp.]MCA1933637.1 acyl-CoA dehydratase activase [Calditerrivibrio sp.]MCA1980726.1 acyl-CoA dehydratase activase [Calditerrivibrio sp.]